MFLFTFPFLSSLSPISLALIDALILGLVLTPLLYSMLSSPIRQQITQEQQKLHEMQDELTGLPSRKLFIELVDHEIKLARRNGWGMAVIVVDPDGLSEINQIFGYGFGDKILVEMANRLKSLLRESDIISRISGDEFGMLLQQLEQPEITPLKISGDEFGLLLHQIDEEAIRPVIRKIAARLEMPFRIDGISVDVGVTMGVSAFPFHGDNTHLLLQRARVALSAARSKLEPYSIFEQVYESRAADRIRLFSDIRRAIAEDEFELHYQPKVHLPDSRVIGTEALLRLKRGPSEPIQKIISFAEQTGIITEITRWVINRAIRQLAEWQAMGIPLHVSINISTHDLLDDDLIPHALTLCREHDVDPARITIEVTESAIMHQPNRAIPMLQRLRESGLHISIDDFGTGYSSLSYLRMLPVDELKIDQSFIRSLAESADNEVLVGLIIEIGNKLGFEVVAEGIETEAQKMKIQQLGCDTIQGYLISHPLPPEQLLQWYRNWLEAHPGADQA